MTTADGRVFSTFCPSPSCERVQPHTSHGRKPLDNGRSSQSMTCRVCGLYQRIEWGAPHEFQENVEEPDNTDYSPGGGSSDKEEE